MEVHQHDTSPCELTLQHERQDVLQASATLCSIDKELIVSSMQSVSVPRHSNAEPNTHMHLLCARAMSRQSCMHVIFPAAHPVVLPDCFCLFQATHETATPFSLLKTLLFFQEAWR